MSAITTGGLLKYTFSIPTRSVWPGHVQCSERDKEAGEEDSVAMKSGYPPARKLLFTLNLNLPLLTKLPGGRLTNKRLREIRTGKRSGKRALQNQTAAVDEEYPPVSIISERFFPSFSGYFTRLYSHAYCGVCGLVPWTYDGG